MNTLSYICVILNCIYYVLCNSEECDDALLKRAEIKATSHLPEKGPENVRLYGGNAWTAKDNDSDQQLIINLGQVMKVTKISTRGRLSTDEFVMEYIISYSTNGLDYAYYKDTGGNIMKFKGNTNDISITKNDFEIPIIAQWIRVNPTRWRNRITMEMELFGCNYDADDLYFNGTALLKMDLLRDPIASAREKISFRFKTSSANGVLLYSRGTQGDYIAVQMREAQLLLNINLGSEQDTSLVVGSLLDDNNWHDVIISRNRRDLLFSVDRVVVQEKIEGQSNYLNLNGQLYIGGVPSVQEGLVEHRNFTGCLENLHLNSTNLFKDVKQAPQNGETSRYEKVNLLYICPQ